MIRLLFFLLLTTFALNCCSSQPDKTEKIPLLDSIVKLEMNLSAFGVESDNFPSIDVYIDFTKDSSSCHKSYYNPANKFSTYKLTNLEISEIQLLLRATDFEKLKKEYTTNLSDQPTSTTKIYTTQKTYLIKRVWFEGRLSFTKIV